MSVIDAPVGFKGEKSPQTAFLTHLSQQFEIFLTV